MRRVSIFSASWLILFVLGVALGNDLLFASSFIFFVGFLYFQKKEDGRTSWILGLLYLLNLGGFGNGFSWLDILVLIFCVAGVVYEIHYFIFRKHSEEAMVKKRR